MTTQLNVEPLASVRGEAHASAAEVSTPSDNRAILINGLSNGMFFAIQVLVVFFISPILVQGLGNSRYGAWLLVNSVISYMALAELGVNASVVRYISRFAGLRDHQSLNRVFSASLIIFSSIGLLVLCASLSLTVFWQRPFGIAGEPAYEMRWLLGILSANLAIGFPLGVFKSVLIGLGRYPAVNLIRIASLLVRNALFVVIIYCGGTLWHIGLAITAGSLLDHACSAIAAFYHHPRLRFSTTLVDRKTFASIRSYSGYVFLAALTFTTASGAPPIIVGAYLGASSVAYFGIAASLAGQAGDALRTVIAVVTPTVSKWDATGKTDSISQLLVSGTRILLFLAMPVHAGVIILGDRFLDMWMGPRYAEVSYPVLVILVLPLPVTLAQALSARILEGIGRVDILFAFTVAQGLTVVLLGLLLVGPLGIEGVAIAASLALLVLSVGTIVATCRVVGVPFVTYLRGAWPLPTASACALAIIWQFATMYLWQIHSWASFLGTGATGIALYALVVLLLDRKLRGLLAQCIRAIVPRLARVS